MSRPFRLALPSKGRLHAPALALARDAGVEVDVTGRALHAHCSQWDIEVLLARADDIPAWAQDGAVEAAVAGQNQVLESGARVDQLAPLGFGRCSLQVAVRETAGIDRVDQLGGCRIATSHPVITRRFLDQNGLQAEVSAIHGSVELAPRLDAADAIVDLVSTGDTLRANGLRPIATVLESEAVLLARADLDDGQRAVAEELTTVIRSVVAARDQRYLMLNAPDGSLDGIIDLLPGLDSPTVLPLAAAGMHAVHAVVPRDRVVDLLGPLRAAGARSLLVLPIDNLIP
jgi:ATP phosphoribosyltransferase